MKTFTNTALLICFALILSCLAGCGKKAEQTGTANQPANQVKAEAQQMNVEQLKAKATNCRQALLEKKAEVEKLAAALAKLPPDQMIGKEGQVIRQQMGELQKTMQPLHQQLQAYCEQLKAKGADVTGLPM
jgi:TolA-binding protein